MNLKSQLEEKIEFVEDRAFNDLRYAIDSSKLEALGWRPKVDWESGIQQTSKLL
jgi:dTDP-glucose 4,6-dehydratase